MKKIFKILQALEPKGYYYRLIVTPEHIDVKLYSDKNLTSPEINYTKSNTKEGRYEMQFCLSIFLGDPSYAN